MDKRKLIIIVSGIGIVLFSYFSMQWLSGMKKTPPRKPPKEVIRYVKAEKVERTFLKSHQYLYIRTSLSFFADSKVSCSLSH